MDGNAVNSVNYKSRSLFGVVFSFVATANWLMSCHIAVVVRVKYNIERRVQDIILYFILSRDLTHRTTESCLLLTAGQDGLGHSGLGKEKSLQNTVVRDQDTIALF